MMETAQMIMTKAIAEKLFIITTKAEKQRS